MNIPQSEKAPLMEWEDQPNEDTIRDLADTVEAMCAESGKHPTNDFSTFTVLRLVKSLGFDESEKVDRYVELVQKEIDRRYPHGQQELTL